MTAYLFLRSEVKDAQVMARYRESVAPLMARFGGKPIIRQTQQLKVVEGRGPDRPLSVIAFPSMEALEGFWNSPEYQPMKEMRQDAASLDIWFVDGVD